MRTSFRLLIEGGTACFTRPEMKAERVSYDVITPSAARGVLEAIHWKPAISWVVDEIHVLKPIRFETIFRNEIKFKASATSVKRAMNAGFLDGLHVDASSERLQRLSMVLKDVAYVIDAHFVMTSKAGSSDNENKHADIFRRRAEKGRCFHQPSLGIREYPAFFKLLEPSDTVSAIEESRDLGFMLWDVDHSSDPKRPLFYRARMENGIISVPAPGSQEIFG